MSRRPDRLPLDGNGERLDPRTRRRAERALGEPLDDVRVHDGAAARSLVDRMGARGVSQGSEIALGSDAGSGVLREAVLAHELAHVAQQRSARAGSEEAAGRGLEHDANAAAAAALLGEHRPVRGRADGMGLRRCDDEAPPKVKEAASKTDPAKLSGFEKLVKGGVPTADAAEKMQLPTDLVDAMTEAWKNSFPGGKSKEQGGILVRTANGSLDWVKATKSTSGSTTMPWDKVPTGATAVARGHTHPYDTSEGGHKGVAFSGADFSTFAKRDVNVDVIHAGDRYFAMTKTNEFEDAMASRSAADKEKYADQMEKDWDTAFAAASGDIVASAREATKKICKKYDLVLYEGDPKGAMKKVDVTK